LNIRKKKLKEYGDTVDKKIQIFGKVIDGENNTPLPNVKLEFGYGHYSAMPPYFRGGSMVRATSDEKGLFYIDNIYGRNISLTKISKENYWERDKKNFFPNFNLKDYIPDKENPITFKLYKEVKDNYLLTWNAGSPARSITVNEGDEAKICFYSIRRFADSYKNLTKYNREIDPSEFDFQLIFEQIEGKAKLVFKDSDGNCSFFLSDNDFLEDSEIEKFEKELKLEIDVTSKDKGQQQLVYLYCRYGKLGLYTRVTLSLYFYEKYSRVELKFLINPYGEYLFETFDINKLDDATQIAIWKSTEIKLKEGVLPTRAELRQFLKLKESEPPKPNPEEIAKKKYQKFLSEVKANENNQEIKFYGKVVDSKGKDIPEAVVSYQWYCFNGQNATEIEYRKLRADKNGLFEINNCWGYQLLINDIFKFEYFRNRVVRGNFNYYFIKESSLNYKADKNKPAIFQLNNEKEGWQFNNRRELTRFERSIKTLEEKDLGFSLKYWDYTRDDEFSFKVKLKQEEQKLVINLSFNPDFASFVLSDKEDLASFTQAATSQVSFELSLPKEQKNYQEVEKYLLVHFLKSNYYAKIQLRFLLNQKETQFQIHSLVDIFGKKNFDSFNDVKYTGAIYDHINKTYGLDYKYLDEGLEYTIKSIQKKFNDPMIKPQFDLPKGTDPKLEFFVDGMSEFMLIGNHPGP